MLWSWLTERRRARILEHPFPVEWEGILEKNVAFWRELDDDERAHMRALVQVFVAEKHWEGCGGLTLTDEMRVTISAEACLLILGRRDHALFADVGSILVYPHAVLSPARPRSFFGVDREPAPTDTAIGGEAHPGGPVILTWDAVKSGARDPHDGRNVVFHELAHKIDMLEGAADGAPPMRSTAEAKRWAEICAKAFAALKDHVEHGQRDFLRPYGATNPAEFFAVATEAFFERATEMKRALPDLYEAMAEWYGQDPSARAHRR